MRTPAPTQGQQHWGDHQTVVEFLGGAYGCVRAALHPGGGGAVVQEVGFEQRASVRVGKMEKYGRFQLALFARRGG